MTSFHLFITLFIPTFLLQNATLASQNPITNDFIKQICSKTSNSTLCLDVLAHLIGHPRSTVAILATNPRNMALSHAIKTRKMIQDLEQGLIAPTPRGRYRSCINVYNDAIEYLVKVKGFMDKGKKKDVKAYVSSAIKRVQSCDSYFEKPPKQLLILKVANKKFQDFCSVIVAICDQMRY